MAYDEELAQRVRDVMRRRRGVAEKKMFGGLAFLVNGHMACGVINDDLMVRVGPDAYEAALKKTGAREMKLTGRPMKGMVFVGPAGHRRAASLKTWVERGLTFVRTLPPK